MAVLGEIRKKSWLLIILIGFALMAFLVGDLFSSGGNLFNNKNELGSVEGSPITAQDYNLTYNRLSKNQQLQGASQNMIAQNAWNQLVSERLVSNQMDEIGLSVKELEQKYYEQAGRFFNSVQPGLVLENGTVDLTAAKQFVSTLKAQAQAGNQQAVSFYEQWLNANPDAVVLNNYYTSLISAGALATDVDAKYAYESTTSNADVSYVMVKYADYKGADKITVSDDEIRTYMEANPKAYKAEPSVNLAYAYFPGEASEEDKSKLLNELNSYLNKQVIKDEAVGITDTIAAFVNAKNDSAYVSRFSDVPFDPQFYTREQFESFPDENLKEALKTAQPGQLIGPTEVPGGYGIIKISKSKAITDSAKTSHILIGYAGSQARNENITRTAEEAKTYADSLLAVVKANPAKFNELASTVSDDLVAAQDNGNIGWVGRFQQGFAQSYRDFAVSNPKGTIELVPSQFGFHIIRIDNVKQKTGYQLASILKTLKPSEKTQESLFNKANLVAEGVQGKSANDFINNARKEGAEVNTAEGVKRFDITLTGLTGTDKEADILKWAFNSNTQAGSLQRFETTNGGQIIAYLTNRFEEGEYNISALRSAVEPILKNQKIFEEVVKQAEGKTDLNAIATAVGSQVTDGTIGYANASIPTVGSEPKIAGAALGLKEGAVSKAIEGSNGVFFVKANKKNVGAAKDDYSNELKRVKTQNQSAIRSQLIPSLKDASDISDNRSELLVN